MTTIKDVARRAGVSPATVSRTVAGGGGVRPDLQKRVMQAIAELGYRPNQHASNLRRQSSSTIGVVVTDVENPYFAEAVSSIEDTAFARGFRVLLCNTRGYAEKQREYLNVLAAERVKGIILVPSAPAAPEISSVIDLGIAVVAFDRTVADTRADAVVIDNTDGGDRLTRHLIAAGHGRIGFVAGMSGLQPSVERRDGYLRAMARAGLEPRVADGWILPDLGHQATIDLIDHDCVSALLLANSMMAAGALEAIRERRLRIPEDVALVMFEDPRWASLVDPPLTALAFPVRRMAESAVRLLLDRLPEPRAQSRVLVFDAELRIRASCGATLAVEGSRG